MGWEDKVPPKPGRVADLSGGGSKLIANASSASLSEKLPGAGEVSSDGSDVAAETHREIQLFGEELKAGVTTISSFWKEFKDYIEGAGIIDNSLSMAAGQAFSDLMNSFVVDLIVPIFATLLGRPNAINFFLILKSGRNVGAQYRNIADAKRDGASVLPYGRFFQKAINFIFLGFTLVLFVRLTRTILFFRQKSLKAKGEKDKEAQGKECHFCYSRISVKAKRCPNCTSMLDTEVDTAADFEHLASVGREP